MWWLYGFHPMNIPVQSPTHATTKTNNAEPKTEWNSVGFTALHHYIRKLCFDDDNRFPALTCSRSNFLSGRENSYASAGPSCLCGGKMLSIVIKGAAVAADLVDVERWCQGKQKQSPAPCWLLREIGKSMRCESGSTLALTRRPTGSLLAAGKLLQIRDIGCTFCS